MEKIISITLAGRVLQLEDSAYMALKAYFDSLERHFAAEESGDEILADIESRVAELLAARLAAGAPAITQKHVEEVIAQLGRAEDFAAEAGEPASGTGPASGTTAGAASRAKRPFLRDNKDTLLGGVCSGLASYLNVDPALVRIVFALLTLGGWGAGVVLYGALWALVPAGAVQPFSGQRLYRNPGDKWLGGVASGLAAYFRKETWVFRLLFAAPFLLSILSGPSLFHFGGSLWFGSLTGTFFLIYIVLWVVLPAAESDFQKMEMRGEKVDIHSIRDNVYADLKDRAQAFGSEVRDSATRFGERTSRFMRERGQSFGEEVRTAGRPLVSRGGAVLWGLIRGFFLFVAGAIAFSLFIALVGYFFGGLSELANGYLLETPLQRTLSWVSTLLLLGVPVLALVTAIVRRTLRLRGTGGRYLRTGYTLLWLAGATCGLVLASNIKRSFARRESVEEVVSIPQPRSGVLTLTTPGVPLYYQNSLPGLQGDIRGWDITDTALLSARVNVVPTLSFDSLYHVVLRRSSWGRTAAAARQRAAALQYPVRSLYGTDSILTLGTAYAIPKARGYRGQGITVEVQVPAGKAIRFDESVEDKLVHFRQPGRLRRHGKDWTFEWDENLNTDWAPGVTYIMQPDGLLADPLDPGPSRSKGSYSIHAPIGSNETSSWAGDSRKRDSLERAKDALERELDRIDED